MAMSPSPLAQVPPRLVTLAELRAALVPHCGGWAWAEDAITDLWRLGAPVPKRPGQPETRVLLPNQFAKWWDEVQARQGHMTGAVDAYGQLFVHARRTSGG